MKSNYYCILFFFTIADAALVSTNKIIKTFAVSIYRKGPRDSFYLPEWAVSV